MPNLTPSMRRHGLREAAIRYTETLAILKLRYPNGPAHAPPGDVDVAAFKLAGEQLEAAATLFAGGQVH